jgi:hypothetical protein
MKNDEEFWQHRFAEPEPTKWHDSNSRASNPGRLQLSEKKLAEFHPAVFKPRGGKSLSSEERQQCQIWLEYASEHLRYGDSQPAHVMSLDPLLVAAYTDELDCVAMLMFPSNLVNEYKLTVGDRLLSVNTYVHLDEQGVAPDLVPGPQAIGRYGNFQPFIADFLSDDQTRIASVKQSEIEEAAWQRAWHLGQEYMATHPNQARKGYPLNSEKPARDITAMLNESKALLLERHEKQQALYRTGLIFWAIGTVIILLSWVSVISYSIGWIGFVFSLIGVLTQLFSQRK